MLWLIEILGAAFLAVAVLLLLVVHMAALGQRAATSVGSRAVGSLGRRASARGSNREADQ